MSYESSELYCKRGNILFRMGRYDEALEAFDEALEIRVDHRYYYNKAVIFQRLRQFSHAEKALQQVLDHIKGSPDPEAKKAQKLYERYLSNIRNREKPLIWWEWWFSEGSKGRRFSGITLFLVLMLALLGPLIIVPTGITMQWLCFEQWMEWSNWWIWYLIPIIIILIILLSPGIRSIGSQGLEMNPEMLKRTEQSLEPLEKPIGPYVREEVTRSRQ